MKLLPSIDKNIYNIINNYINSYSIKLNKQARTRTARVKKIRFSTNKILLSKPDFKHTNKSVTIVSYFYNRRIKYYINKILLAKTINNLHDKNKYNKIIKIFKNKLSTITSYYIHNNTIKNLSTYNKIFINNTDKFLYDMIYKYFLIEVNTIILKQLIYVEKHKFDMFYLLPLKKLIESIYKKQIYFNFVNIKYIYNSAGILSESIVSKIRKKSNRPSIVSKKLFEMFKLPAVNKLTLLDKKYKQKYLQNVKLNKSNCVVNINKDILENFIFKNHSYNTYYKYKNNITNIMNFIKYKYINGIRVEMAGRLTRRHTAERSISNLKYKGNIRDIDSSYKGLSTTVIRGYARSNVQYNLSKSKLRTGSFGIKSWVSSNRH